MKEIISTQNAPTAIGAYSQAVVANGMLFASGQLGIDPATGEFAGADFRSQAFLGIGHVFLNRDLRSGYGYRHGYRHGAKPRERGHELPARSRETTRGNGTKEVIEHRHDADLVGR